MPIIYTYPSATPTASDLLVFSDVSNTDPKNATRKCTINDLIALMPGAVPGAGTVTSVTVVDGTYINLTATPDPIIGVGSVSADLNAADGAVGASGRFLTKENAWAVPPDTNTTYTAGDGLDLTGTTFSTDLKANGGLVIEVTELAVDLGASSITGTLAVGDGGTGATTFSTYSVITNAGNAAGPLADSGSMTDGQLIIGKTTNAPQRGTLVSGGGTVTITYADPNINLEVAAGGTMTSFNVDGDSGPAQTIVNLDTLNILGDGPSGVPTATGGLVTAAVVGDTIKVQPPAKVDPYAGLGLKGSSGGAFTPSTNLAAYYCLGATVYVEFYMSWAHAEQAGCSGDIILTGLPIAAYQTGTAIDNGNCVIHVNKEMSTGTVSTLAPTTGWVGFSATTEMTFRKMHGTTHIFSNSVWTDVVSEGAPIKALAGTITYMQ